MKEIINNKYDIQFKHNISQIHSISIDTEYNIEDNIVNGKFIISGDYKEMGITLRYTDFTYDIPFTYDLKGELKDELNIDINDFTYTFDKDILTLNIEYVIEGDIMEFNEFEKFIQDNDVEVVDFREEDKPKEIILPDVEELESEPDLLLDEEREEDIIMNNIDTRDDEYITYHVYVVSENDSIDSILVKFNINLDTLKDYNDFDEIKVGMKLIIPYNE